MVLMTIAPGCAAIASARVASSTKSALFKRVMMGRSPAPISINTFKVVCACLTRSGDDRSTTCNKKSACTASSKVALKASTSWWGSRRTKPTVSVKSTARPDDNFNLRVVGSNVANNLSSAKTSAPVRRLSSEDFPALVYPTIEKEGSGMRWRCLRWVARCATTAARSRRTFAILSRIFR